MFSDVCLLQKAVFALVVCTISGVTAKQSSHDVEHLFTNDVSSLIGEIAEQMEKMNKEMADIRAEMREYRDRLTLNETRSLREALNNITIMQEELRQCREYRINKDRETSNWNLNSLTRQARHDRDTQIIPLQEMEGAAHLVRLLVPRSCHDWLSMGFTTSGYYLIDPDGREVGEEPIRVFCDMITGFTFIGHNMEDSQSVELCDGPGCHTVDIRYNASMSQIEALIYNSQSCNQPIKLECKHSPLSSGNTPMTWWEDRNGHPHMYWSGSQHGQRICRCGVSGTCVIPNLNCNCDAAIKDVWLYDEGTLSNTTSLPVTKLHFGKDTNFVDSEMQFRLAPLRCYGYNRHAYPTSCKELLWSGVHQPGYYFLGTPDNVTLNHCPMKTRNDMEERSAFTEDLQILSMIQELGSHNPVQSQEIKNITRRLDNLENSRMKTVIFHAQAVKDIEDAGRVKFGDVRIDTHEAYLLGSGEFVVPEDGTYFISFYSERQDVAVNTIVRLKNNMNDVALARGDTQTKFSTFGFSLVIPLIKRDRLHVHLQSGTLFGCYYGCNGFSIVKLS